MTTIEYLEEVLSDQTLTNDSDEMKKLREHREQVEALLRKDYKDDKPTICYGGSKAKGTMVRASYDLDICCYFPREKDGAGRSLEEIYNNVAATLVKDYIVEKKTSALRLKDQADSSAFHIDVVPGRFVDGNEGDVYIYQASAEKCRLKTNLDVHLAHIRNSGVIDAIRLMKLWAARNNLRMKTFVLELLVVDFLKNKKEKSLDGQLVDLWTELRDHADTLVVKDPANPEGNDLSSYLDSIRGTLSLYSRSALDSVERDNWKAIFGQVESEKAAHVASLQRIAAAVPNPSRPWFRG